MDQCLDGVDTDSVIRSNFSTHVMSYLLDQETCRNQSTIPSETLARTPEALVNTLRHIMISAHSLD